MELNFKNNLLTEDEKKTIRRTVDDKVVELFEILYKKADGVFFGDMRRREYLDKISSLKDECKTIEDLINDLDEKSVDELNSIASEYKLTVDSNLDRNSMVIQMKKSLNDKRMSNNNEVAKLYNASDRNFDNTFEHTVNSIIEELNDELYNDQGQKEERNVGRRKSLEIVRDSFNVISDCLKKIHVIYDKICDPVLVYHDNLEELDNIKEQTINYQEMYALVPNSNDVNSKPSIMPKLLEEIKSCRKQKEALFESIDIQKEKFRSIYDTGIDFVEFKNVIYDNLRTIEANIEDAMISTRITHIQTYMTALNEFFYELVSKQFDIQNYLDDNRVERIIQDDRSLNYKQNEKENSIEKEPVSSENIFAVNAQTKYEQPEEQNTYEDTQSTQKESYEDYMNKTFKVEPAPSYDAPVEDVDYTQNNDTVSSEEQPVLPQELTEEPEYSDANSMASSEMNGQGNGIEQEIPIAPDFVNPEPVTSEETQSQDMTTEFIPTVPQEVGTIYSVTDVKDTDPNVLLSAKAKAKNTASNILGGEGRVKQ